MYVIARTYEATPKNTKYYPQTAIYFSSKLDDDLVAILDITKIDRFNPLVEVDDIKANRELYKVKNAKAFAREKAWADRETARGNWKVSVAWYEI